jgi:iron complex outermembrane receptor protein
MNLLVAVLLASAASVDTDTLVVPLPEVVVTGARVPESIFRVPAAVSVVDRSAYVDCRGISLKDALGRVPGVYVQSRGGAQDVRVTIRGFGARGNGERSNAGNMRGIRVMTDGLPVTEPDGRSSLDLVDIGFADRIEIARSNSSTLYGNASGGVVHLRTNLAFDTPWAEVRERAGSFGFHREQALTGFTIGRGHGTVSMLNSDFDGWRSHSGSSATLFQGRFAIPLDDHSRLGLLLDAASTLNRYPGALTRAQFDSLPEQANPKFVSRDERRWNRLGRVGTTLDRALTRSQDLALNFFVEPKVLQRSERNRFRDFTRYHLGGGGTWQFRATPADGWEARTTVGADEAFQDGAILFYGLQPDGSRATNVVSNKREAANSAGVSVQQEMRWNDRWSLRIGGRYDNLRYISEDRIDPTLNDERTFDRITPAASLAFFTGTHTIYVALGGGVEAPAFNEIDPPPPFDTLTSFNPFLEPMWSTTSEIGARGLIDAAGRLRYDVSLYWIDVHNEIVPFNGGAHFFTAGRSRRRGVELGLGWTPIAPLTIDGAVTLSDNAYVDYANDIGDFRGNQMPGLPEIVANGAAHYRLPLGFMVGGTVEHLGDSFADDSNEADVPSHTLLGGSVAWEHPFGSQVFRAFLAGDNLTDERYVESVFINGVRSNPADVSTGEYFEPGLPRNWSAGLTVRWR